MGSSSGVTFGESLSVIVTVTGATVCARTPWSLCACAVTCTCLSASSTWLFTAVSVALPLLAVASAGMVSVVLLRVKSAATAGGTAAAATTTVVAALEGWLSVAVIILLSVPPWPSSRIESADSSSVTVGGASLSVTLSVVPFTSRPVTVPSTVTISSGSSISSSVAVRMKVAVPLSASAAIVSGKASTAGKSSPAVAVPPVTDTVTVVSLLRGDPSSVPVTVTVRLLVPSATSSGFTRRVTAVDGLSSSVTVTDTGAAGTGLVLGS